MGAVENGVDLSGTPTLNDDNTCNNFRVNTNKPQNKNNDWGPKKFKKENHVIKLMV